MQAVAAATPRLERRPALLLMLGLLLLLVLLLENLNQQIITKTGNPKKTALDFPANSKKASRTKPVGSQKKKNK